MTDPLPALFAAICADPADDTPRLVYADCLEERNEPGDAERSELIKSQVELTGTKDVLGCRTDHEPFSFVLCRLGCRRCSLRRRERELLVDLWGRGVLTQGLPGVQYHTYQKDGKPVWAMSVHGSLLELEVCRGFVHTVRCRLADWYGGECLVCDGLGRLRDDLGVIPGHCRVCHGTGRTPAHGRAIVRSQPVERVETERRPWNFGGVDKQRGWWPEGGIQVHNHASIPTAVYAFINAPMKLFGAKAFPTEADALAALSDALIRWAKKENER